MSVWLDLHRGEGGGLPPQRSSSYRGYACVICQHQAAHPMAHGDVRTPLCEGYLNTSRSPGNEGGKAPLADAEQTLVHIGRVDFTLDDVEYGYVAALLAGHGRHHAVLRLQQPPHDVQDCRFPHCLCLFDLIAGEGRIRRHEEVAAGRWDQRG